MPEPDIQTVVLEKVRVGIGRYLHKAELSHLRYDFFLEEIGEALALKLVADIASEELGSEVVKYPQNWWEAVKERFAPNWFLDRWPVLYRRVEVNARALYPRVSLPEYRPTIQVYTTEFPEWEMQDG